MNGRDRSLREALAEATRILAAAGVASPGPDALALAAHRLGVGVGEAHRLALLGATEPDGLGDLVAARAQRIPLQHLTGRAGFRRLELSVGPGVFVPRPETEITAGLVIDWLRAELDRGRSPAPGSSAGSSPSPLVVDLGTGSGAIALAVKDEVGRARVVGVEMSAPALAWARRNVQRLGLDVELRQGDLRSVAAELDGLADVVVSNPPYVPDQAVPRDPEVREHDPALALYGGGPDGLALPRAVVSTARRLLRNGGLLVMEHADVQGPAVLALVAGPAWSDARDHRDLTGRPRVLTARRVRSGRGD